MRKNLGGFDEKVPLALTLFEEVAPLEIAKNRAYEH